MSNLFYEIGQNILLYLDEKGMTQTELGERLGISRQVVHKIIQGKKAINVQEITNIAEVLQVTVNDLVATRQTFQEVDALYLLMGEIENANTKGDIQFLNFVMDEMIDLPTFSEMTRGDLIDRRLTHPVRNELSSDQVRELETLVKAKLGEINKTSRILKDEIFTILADHSTLLQYPIDDDEFCALVCMKQNQIFSILNTSLPYDKQIFAAAHELYHIWYDLDLLRKGEVLNSRIVDTQLEPNEINAREAKANRFAAMFLVPTDTLRNELDYLGISKQSMELSHIVRLMDTFGVPYKTMVRRLHEIEFIDARQCDQFLSIPDRDEKSGVLLLQKKMRIGLHLQNRTKEIRFGNLVENAVVAFEQGVIPYEKLRNLLSYARVKPEEVIDVPDEHRVISDDELMALLEDEED